MVDGMPDMGELGERETTGRMEVSANWAEDWSLQGEGKRPKALGTPGMEKSSSYGYVQS